MRITVVMLGALMLAVTACNARAQQAEFALAAPSARVEQDKAVAEITQGDFDVDFGQMIKSPRLKLRSSAVLVVDLNDQRALYAKNTDAVLPIASITKLMTAMVVLDSGVLLDQLITVTSADVDTVRNSGSRLRVGATLSRREMLRLALMASENRAASALARTGPGGTMGFVTAMNRKAAGLGMMNTRFVDATGLSEANVSTAQDLARMVRAGQHYELIGEFSTQATHKLAVAGSRGKLGFRNTNILVNNKHWDIDISKTGYISEAGRCLVMLAQIADQPVIIVLLDSYGKFSRIGDANRIKQWIEDGSGGRGDHRVGRAEARKPRNDKPGVSHAQLEGRS